MHSVRSLGGFQRSLTDIQIFSPWCVNFRDPIVLINSGNICMNGYLLRTAAVQEVDPTAKGNALAALDDGNGGFLADITGAIPGRMQTTCAPFGLLP